MSKEQYSSTVEENSSGEWKKTSTTGYNDKLLKLAENLNKLARVTIQAKLDDLKGYVNAEARRINHPEFDKFAKKINDVVLK